MATKSREQLRTARHARIRKRVVGTSDKPRLAVYRSLKHIYAQIIDDSKGHTVAAASSNEKELSAGGNKDGAKAVGTLLAKRAKEAGVSQVIFDRGGFRYHGRVASLAEGAREGGLEF
jgi:large subunit ribosomal protein L18